MSIRTKNELKAVTAALKKERPTDKLATDRRGSWQRPGLRASESMRGVRLPMVSDTPLAAGVIRDARKKAEVLEVATPSAITGGPDQLRGTEHLHDRSVGQGIMLSPQRDTGVTQTGTTTGGGDIQGLTALAQTIILLPPGGQDHPSWMGTQTRWRETWDVEYFLKALEEIYAVSEVDKLSDARGVWRALMTKLQVEYSNAGVLSLSYTAVLLEANNKHLLHLTTDELPEVITSTYNPQDKTKQSLTDFLKVCEGLIVKWQKAQYNEGVRRGKRKEGQYDTERDKKQRANVAASAFK